jgi:hypothetical protein
MIRVYFFFSFATKLLYPSSWGSLSDERTGVRRWGSLNFMESLSLTFLFLSHSLPLFTALTLLCQFYSRTTTLGTILGTSQWTGLKMVVAFDIETTVNYWHVTWHNALEDSALRNMSELNIKCQGLMKQKTKGNTRQNSPVCRWTRSPVHMEVARASEVKRVVWKELTRKQRISVSSKCLIFISLSVSRDS